MCGASIGEDNAPCSKNSECKAGLHCVRGFFSTICKPYKEVQLGDSCQKGMFGPDLICADGLECLLEHGWEFFGSECADGTVPYIVLCIHVTFETFSSFVAV